MLRFFEHTFNISATRGDVRTIRANVNIRRSNPDPNARVILALRSFDVRFTGAEHHLLRVLVMPELDGFGPFIDTVPIRLTFGLRDSSGHFDDPYEGTIGVGIIVVDNNRVKVFGDSQSFPPRRAVGPRMQTAFLQQNDPTETGVTFLQGFDIGFERDDHHVLEIMADVDSQTIPVLGNQFDAVRCRLGLRDSSGFWDDPYGGSIRFSSLWFPLGTYGVDQGVVTVQNVNAGPTTRTSNHFIQRNVPQNRLFVGLTGFQCSFIGGDHDIHRLVSQVRIDQVRNNPQQTEIRIAYTGGIRDRSGNFDDQYASTGQYTILSAH